jgi:hypothetical protein
MIPRAIILSLPLLAAASILGAAASALAETYPDCEKFEDAFAYNRCLASHGPVAGQAHTVAAPDGVRAIRGAQGSDAIHRIHTGRMSMTINVEPEKPLRLLGKSPHAVLRRN